VADASKAVQEGAPLVHPDAPNNMCFDWELGNPKEEVDAALEAAHHITKLEFINQRVIPNAIEPRSAIGHYESAGDKHTLYTTSQNPHLTRLLMSAFVLGIPEHKVRVVAPDVGGGFGSKIFHYAEEALIIWVSRQIKRPVKWTAERSESFHDRCARTRPRDQSGNGLRCKRGNIVGLRVKTYANLGAYLSTFAPAVPTWLHGTLLQGLYTTPKIHM
jgi:carbon-monoxide dehydrogenase large subunit